MLKELIESVDKSIDEVVQYIEKKSPISYTLLLGQADIIEGLEKHVGTNCVIDYQLDTYNDETRNAFYLKYMNKNYRHDGFLYQGEDGIYDLNIEMMIYTHLWESSFLYKTIYRIASIVKNGEYVWKLEMPKAGIYNILTNDIVAPLKQAGLKLGDIIEDSYCSVLRNSFAHSLYQIVEDRKIIHTRSNNSYNTFSFEEFQRKFLQSIIICNHLSNKLLIIHDSLASKNAQLTEEFMTPDGLKVSVYGCMVQRGNSLYPEFRLVRSIY